MTSLYCKESGESNRRLDKGCMSRVMEVSILAPSVQACSAPRETKTVF